MINKIWVFILIFVVFAQLVKPYKIYVMNKKGGLVPINGVVHIDIDDTSATMKERLTKQLDDFLREKHKQRFYFEHNSQKRTTDDYYDFRNGLSPVVYSNGRYTLDLDKIDVHEVKDVSNRPSKDEEYYDPADNFRDYYDYIGVNDRLRTDDKIPWDRIAKYLKENQNLRKYNALLLGNKNFRSKDKILYAIDVIRNRNKNKKKRFNIVDNNQKHRHYKANNSKKKKYVQQEEEDKSKDKKESGSESFEYDDGVYLQGNTLVKFNNEENKQQVDSSDSDDSDDSDEDGRRRLPHFMPKRYHWKPKDIKKLGYYWFNGPQGKYPGPVPL